MCRNILTVTGFTDYQSYFTQRFINVPLWKEMGSKYTRSFQLDLVIIGICAINWVHADLVEVYDYGFVSMISRYIPFPALIVTDAHVHHGNIITFANNHQIINDNVYLLNDLFEVTWRNILNLQRSSCSARVVAFEWHEYCCYGMKHKKQCSWLSAVRCVTAKTTLRLFFKKHND